MSNQNKSKIFVINRVLIFIISMYKLNDNIVVSDSHMIKYLGKWIPTSNHPNAIKIETYNEPYLYCLNTSNKTINIDEFIFSDWDEIYDDELDEIITTSELNSLNDIHKYMDSGFIKNTEIKLKNGTTKCIKDICVGDILENNESVYGIVEINGTTLSAQYTHYFDNKIFEGGPNLTLCDKNIDFWSTIHLAEKYDGCLDKKINFKHQKVSICRLVGQDFNINWNNYSFGS
jgi:hypothetical protein